ncbi:MAG: thioredoxin family protein [Tissierellaceae bacterium]|nr:thioredoxin family protein [Tissierellaceae bacterium]
MSFLNDEVKGQLKGIFEKMNNEVTLALFTKEGPCETCPETQSYLEEVVSTTDKLSLKLYDLNTDKELAEKYEVSHVPSIVVLDKDKEYRGIKFVGIPAGHEINSLVNTLLSVSGSGSPLSKELEERVAKVDKPVNIKVFVTLSCPHCPGAVEKAHLLALENPNISAEMVEAQTFAALSDQFNVSSVPKIVINDEFEFVGNQPLEVFMDTIEKA